MKFFLHCVAVDVSGHLGEVEIMCPTVLNCLRAILRGLLFLFDRIGESVLLWRLISFLVEEKCFMRAIHICLSDWALRKIKEDSSKQRKKGEQ